MPLASLPACVSTSGSQGLRRECPAGSHGRHWRDECRSTRHLSSPLVRIQRRKESDDSSTERLPFRAGDGAGPGGGASVTCDLPCHATADTRVADRYAKLLRRLLPGFPSPFLPGSLLVFALLRPPRARLSSDSQKDARESE